MSEREELKKMPARHRPFARLVLTAFAICKKERPSLKEREQIYRRLLIYVRSLVMIMSEATKDDLALKYAKRIVSNIETTLSKTGDCYTMESSINDEWDAYFDSLYMTEMNLKGGDND